MGSKCRPVFGANSARAQDLDGQWGVALLDVSRRGFTAATATTRTATTSASTIPSATCTATTAGSTTPSTCTATTAGSATAPSTCSATTAASASAPTTRTAAAITSAARPTTTSASTTPQATRSASSRPPAVIGKVLSVSGLASVLICIRSGFLSEQRRVRQDGKSCGPCKRENAS